MYNKFDVAQRMNSLKILISFLLMNKNIPDTAFVQYTEVLLSLIDKLTISKEKIKLYLSVTHLFWNVISSIHSRINAKTMNN